jgi:hypothetical protein
VSDGRVPMRNRVGQAKPRARNGNGSSAFSSSAEGTSHEAEKAVTVDKVGNSAAAFKELAA